MEVGRYRILEAIGRGGMAEVYRAVAIGPAGFEKEVVVKRILPRLANKPDLAQMIVDEAKIASRLDHPNIVQIVDLGTIDDEFFLVMELVRGMDLGRVVRQLEARGERVPVGTALRIVAEMCRALDYAHRQADATGWPLGIVHRDVSPQNVLLSGEGAVKLGDFGIARAAGFGGHTETGLLKGKIAYMAPEQVLDSGVDARTDLYAAGIVLYELLTGQHPFATANEAETLRRARAPEIQPPSAVRPALDPHLDALVMRALQLDPGRRYATGGEMLHAIEAYLRDHAMAVTTTDVAALVRLATLAPSHEEAPIDLDGAFADEIERLGADASSGLSRFTRTHDLPAQTGSGASSVPTRHETPQPASDSGARQRSGARWLWVGGAAAIALALVGVATWASRPTPLGPPLQLQPVAVAGKNPSPSPSRSPTPTPDARDPSPTPDARDPSPTPDARDPSPTPADREPGREPRGPTPGRPRVQPPLPEPDPPSVAPPALGTLRIGSSPHWARISIDGTVRGTTPLVVSVPAGAHSISASNPELGRSETKRVTVEAGRQTSVRFDPF